MAKPGKTGFARIFDAFFYSMKGFKAVWKHEAAFRQEALLAAILIPLAFFTATSAVELVLLIASVLWVIMAELANSAVEAVVDRTGSERHELSGRAKDIGSALVFVSLALLAIVWVIIIANRFNWLGFLWSV
ncbi:diacylglycerol kinase [Pleionea litopenaei]|uniref:Diacylglycerol kinase n=1 Tax=Pleionea litopenaei TaxID=3070815 RepID=A0AA51RSF5_9GAMM|nr:diacylglycerol kinase [Pleionea sp. HL-JVS1]WMS86629.1 diacylglycerol kinase [Pleionea sp. HL-JVS1]